MVGLWPLLLALFAAQTGPAPQTVTRMVVEQTVIWRVPLQPRPVMAQIEWTERGGPKCIAVGRIRRALLSGPEHVDFVFARGGRIRAEFDEDCPALDYYGNFYLQPQDGRLCAGRDAVHSRMGGSCTIGRFRQLVPHLKHLPDFECLLPISAFLVNCFARLRIAAMASPLRSSAPPSHRF
jgi:hypothetical protein